MKNTFSYDDIYTDLLMIDCGCCYVGKGRYKKDREIILDNDDTGNAKHGWINLKY